MNACVDKVNFASLATKPVSETGNLINKGGVDTFTSSFNPDLYSDYLLSILNQDKICSINGYWVKVDMDNGFCSVIDAIAYPGEYDNLKNNVFSNTHIMTFVNPDEPVIEVLDKMRKGELSWEKYQIELSNAKGGQGICFKSGTEKNKKDKYEIIAQNYRVYTAVGYYKAFLHFQLSAETDVRYGQTVVFIEPRTISGKFEWEGVCKGRNSGTYSCTDKSKNNQNTVYIVYSGGSALKTAKMTAQTSIAAGSGSILSIGY